LLNKDKVYVFNHLSDVSSTDYPLPKLDKNGNEFKKKWKNGTWIKKQCILKDGVVLEKENNDI